MAYALHCRFAGSVRSDDFRPLFACAPAPSHSPSPSSRMSMNNSDLLKELRIDRKASPETPPQRGLWIALAGVVVLVLLGVAGWALFGRDSATEVKTATVTAVGNGGSSASVLDATGYVVARRMATVSAKI